MYMYLNMQIRTANNFFFLKGHNMTFQESVQPSLYFGETKQKVVGYLSLFPYYLVKRFVCTLCQTKVKISSDMGQF